MKTLEELGYIAIIHTKTYEKYVKWVSKTTDTEVSYEIEIFYTHANKASVIKYLKGLTVREDGCSMETKNVGLVIEDLEAVLEKMKKMESENNNINKED